MSVINSSQIATGVQQIVMRLIGVMIENGQLTEEEARRIFVEAAMTLRNHPRPDTNGAAYFVDMLAKQFSERTAPN